jgi:hypothetical protein
VVATGGASAAGFTEGEVVAATAFGFGPAIGSAGEANRIANCRATTNATNAGNVTIDHSSVSFAATTVLIIARTPKMTNNSKRTLRKCFTSSSGSSTALLSIPRDIGRNTNADMIRLAINASARPRVNASRA